MLLCDTGVLLAAGNIKDRAHQACVGLLRQVEGPLLVPSPVLGEIGYLLQSRVGPQAEAAFLKSFGGDGFHIAELEDQDIRRMAELVEAYLDVPLGITAAAVIAIAERLQLTEAAMLDHRHFGVVRPSHTRAFILLPGSEPEPGVSALAVSAARYPLHVAHPSHS
jgi:predicted nucleic acid-binding protein